MSNIIALVYLADVVNAVFGVTVALAAIFGVVAAVFTILGYAYENYNDENQKNRIIELFEKECKAIVEDRHKFDILKAKTGITETFGL